MRVFDTIRRFAARPSCPAPANNDQPSGHALGNPAAFFDRIRLMAGRLSQNQVNNINLILRHASQWPVAWVAYALATAFHECRLMPMHERGGPRYLAKYDTGRLAKTLGNTPAADGDGIKYAGRGFVQLTGAANYRKAGAALGIDLIDDPDKALEPETAARILVWGMEGGFFTNKKLGHYLLDKAPHEAFVRARQIINGNDRAELIADYADKFQAALIEGCWG